jgi:SAM-dependent methyltransferase
MGFRDRLVKLVAGKRDQGQAPKIPPLLSGGDARWEPVVYAGWEAVVPPRDLWVGPGDPLVHFFRWSWEYLSYLSLLCEMREDASVLELGCNHGRTMLGLLGYLRSPGRYEGLDILPAQIAFARENIRPDSFEAHFTVADVYNGTYNPAGRFPASEYRFPYDDRSFDVAYAASLFTHLLPADAENYLRETRRVLKPGGRALFSFFLLDDYRGPGTSAHSLYEFNFPLAGHDGVAVHDKEHPEAVIAYERRSISRMADESGLEARRFVPGVWSRSHPVSVNEQDLVLFEAR